MSDYEDYDADYGYEEEQMQMDEEYQEEDVQAVLEADIFDADDLVRKNAYEEAITAFKDIFQRADASNLRGKKVQTLNKLLSIYIQTKDYDGLKSTLKSISELNEQEHYTESALRFIIQNLQGLDRAVYEGYWEDLDSLIEKQDSVGKLKSYLSMLKKQLNDDSPKSQIFYKKVKKVLSEQATPAGYLTEVYSLEVKYHRQKNIPMEDLLKKIQLSIPLMEDETFVNESSLSEIKEAIAEVMYQDDNYVECAQYLCDCFCENAKFGKNSENIKVLLKTNVLVLLLCRDKSLMEKRSHNALLHESTANFKMDPDVQALFGLTDAFNELDINRFSEIFPIIFTTEPNKPFTDIFKRVLTQLKRQKLQFIIKPYKTIKFDYICRRLAENLDTIRGMLFELIVEKKINGVLHLDEGYLQILPQENKYFTIQLTNLRQLTQRL